MRTVIVAIAVAAVAGAAGFFARGDAGSGDASVQRQARFWQQLTSAFEPGTERGLTSMADHRLLTLPGDLAMALHFDNMDLSKARNLNWVALAVPGRFTKADQERVKQLYGPGFTHFHSFENDAHGGRAGTKGVWFVHVGTRDFRSPFGQVSAGEPDLRFMPTPPPG